MNIEKEVRNTINQPVHSIQKPRTIVKIGDLFQMSHQ
jgi:hypothetical protein